jgi:superfamily II DNA or RNA helicase/HKD family nuclease
MSEDRFKAGLNYSFFAKNEESVTFRSRVLTNDRNRDLRVLTAIQFELRHCKSFFWSVAFATAGGVKSVLSQLVELQNRGVSGRILLSTYQTFTQPQALRELMKFPNLEVRLMTEEVERAHWKGYVFEHESSYAVIVGSSNLTEAALSTNRELNVELHMKEESSMFIELQQEFELDWDRSRVLNQDFIDRYTVAWGLQNIQRHSREVLPVGQSVVPNQMQKVALERLKQVRAEGHPKALVVSATGTGKTFLAAFDAKEFNSKRLLFVVHRENIARRAMETFQIVHGTAVSMGLYSGGQFDKDADFVFATVQTIARESHLQIFDPEHFDYVIIDEAHRSGAQMHLKLMRYFRPKFMLGMTATPERSDGFNVFEEFNHIIAYEIRLKEALEAEILSSFHYFGIEGIEVEGYGTVEGFNQLAHEQRVDHIIEKVTLYGADSPRIRGLMFCSRIEEAKAIAVSLNSRGIRALALTGTDLVEVREKAIRRLESDDLDSLDYLLVVDIFNEGIDIPKINQVVMLRPTESVIVFVQQLGRGLRKAPDKEFLTVIDFIGNYKTNFMIPIALYGDNRYDKEGLRRNILSENMYIPGSSTVSFDEVSRSRVFKSISDANLSSKKLLKHEFELLHFELGRPPRMVDFVRLDKRFPTTYFTNEDGKSPAFKSYLHVLQAYVPDEVSSVSSREFELAEILVRTVSFKRIAEFVILKTLLESDKWVTRDDLAVILAQYNAVETMVSAVNNLALGFDPTAVPFRDRHKAKEYAIIELDDERVRLKLGLSVDFKTHLQDLASSMIELLASQKYASNGLTLYKKYTRRDAMLLLGFDTMMNEQSIGGYRYDKNRGVMAIFMKTHKEGEWDHIVDRFTSPSTLDYSSKPGQKLGGAVHSWIKKHSYEQFHLFCAKDSGEGPGFYYMGLMTPHVDRFENAPHHGKNFVRMHFTLKVPASKEMYDYLMY